MLDEKQTNILFTTTGYAAIFAFGITMLLGQSSYYLVGAAVTITLSIIYAGISHLSEMSEEEK